MNTAHLLIAAFLLALFSCACASSRNLVLRKGDKPKTAYIPKGGKVRIIFKADKNIRNISVYSSKSGNKIAHGKEFKLLENSTYNGRLSTHVNSRHNDTIKFVIKLTNVQYEDDVILFFYAESVNKIDNSSVKEKPVQAKLLIYKNLLHCTSGKLAVIVIDSNTVNTSETVCGKPLSKVTWYLDDQNIGSGMISKVSEGKHVISKTLHSAAENCGKSLKYIAEGFNQTNLTSAVEVPFVPTLVEIRSVEFKDNCASIAIKDVNTGTCNVTYDIMFLGAKNETRRKSLHETNEGFIQHCFANNTITNQFNAILIRMSKGNEKGNWSAFVIEKRDDENSDRINSPPTYQIVAVVASVVVFFLVVYMITYRVLQKNDEEVKKYLVRQAVRDKRKKTKAKQLKIINLWKPRAQSIEEVENEKQERQKKFVSLWRTNAHKTKEEEEVVKEEEEEGEQVEEEEEEEERGGEGTNEAKPDSSNERGKHMFSTEEVNHLKVLNKWRANVQKEREEKDNSNDEVAKQEKVLRRWRGKTRKIDENAKFFNKWRSVAHKAEKETVFEDEGDEEENSKQMKVLKIWRRKLQKLDEKEEEKEENQQLKYLNQWRSKCQKDKIDLNNHNEKEKESL